MIAPKRAGRKGKNLRLLNGHMMVFVCSYKVKNLAYMIIKVVLVLTRLKTQVTWYYKIVVHNVFSYWRMEREREKTQKMIIEVVLAYNLAYMIIKVVLVLTRLKTQVTWYYKIVVHNVFSYWREREDTEDGGEGGKRRQGLIIFKRGEAEH